MSRCTITNHTGRPSRAVALIAEGTGRFAGVRARPIDPSIVGTMMRFDRWIGLVLERPVPPGGAIEVEVGREPGGQDGPCDGSFRTASDALVPAQPFLDLAPFDRTTLAVAPRGGDAELDVRTILRRLEVLSLRGAASRTAGRQAAAMWWLDSQTHPRLLDERKALLTWPRTVGAEEATFRVAAVSALTTELGLRAATRQRLARAGERDPAKFAAGMRPLGVSRCAMAMVAELVRRGFAALDPELAHPTREDDDVDTALVAEAMMAFAAGDLRLDCSLPAEVTDPRLSECAPDGPFFFLFAELAMVAARMRLHGDFWSQALPGLVAAQLCYRRAYGDPARASSRDELMQAARRPPKLATAASDRARELTRLRGQTLDELERTMGENIHATLRDTFAGG